MNILRLISRLIDYPTGELQDNWKVMIEMVDSDTSLSDQDKKNLHVFIDERCSMDILDWQSDYDALFERGRSLSLLLFEHIHGESRDRGQAMIDLIAEYKKAGLDIGMRELPDYIPLYLEFVATQGAENGQGWLQDVAHILALLKVRLEQRDCDYSVLFETLVNLSGAPIDYNDLATQVKGEKRDDSKEAIDKVWEEEMVTFGSTAGGPDSDNSMCGSGVNRPAEGQRRDTEVPIQFFDAAEPKGSPVSSSMRGN